VLPLRIYSKIKKATDIWNNAEHSLVVYGENKIKSEGSVVVKGCLVKGERKNIRFVVADVNSEPILGLNTCKMLNLIKKVESVDLINSNSVDESKMEKFIIKNKEVFEGVGKFQCKYKIQLGNNAKPKFVVVVELRIVLNQDLKVP